MYPKLDSSRAGTDALQEIERLQARVRELERDIERQHRLATLGTIAGLIAHEFNNILTPMLSYAQMALARPEDADLARRALERSSAAAERAGRIASAILDLVRDEQPVAPVAVGGNLIAHPQAAGAAPSVSAPASRGPFRGLDTDLPARTDVSRSIRRTLDCLGRDPARDGIALSLTVEPGLCARIEPVALEHALLNIILNARQAMLAGPRRGHALNISARASTPEPALSAHATAVDTRGSGGSGGGSGGGNGGGNAGEGVLHPGRHDAGAGASAHDSPAARTPTGSPAWCVIEVADTGPGMDAAVLQRLFTPFFSRRAGDQPGRRASEPDAHRGTGLGMSVCKGLIERAGGYVQAWSSTTEPTGTTIRIVLPASRSI
jgi:signal transduction histidine kinase